MTYRELKKQIKKASKEQKIDKITAYITSWGANDTVSNFLEDLPNFNQICRAEDEDLLTLDWDTWEVI